MTHDAIAQLEKTVELAGEDLRRELPPVLERFDEETTRTLVRDHPEVFGKLVRGLEDADVAAFVTDTPEASEDYQDILWTGLGAIVESDPDLQSKISLDVTVNFEADDCPMEGHLLLDSGEGTLSGGAGTALDPDLTIGGPAENIVGLITGDVDPVQGFMQGSYEMDGSLATGTRLAPVIKALAKAIPGE